jgi:hypothetical protein
MVTGNGKKSVFDRPVVKVAPTVAKKVNAAEEAAREKLQVYGDFMLELERAQADLELAIEAQMPQKVRDAIRDLKDEFAAKLEGANANLEELKAEIRSLTLTVGHTVENGSWMAVCRAGSTTWNKDALEVYATLHPEILDYRKQGEPTVAITPKRRSAK